MQFFDIVSLKDDADIGKLALRLGYRKILNAGTEIHIIGSPGDAKDGKNIIRSNNSEAVAKAIRNNSVIGVIAGDLRLDKKLLEEIRSEEKLVLIPLSDIICSRHETLQGSIKRAKGTLRDALMSRVKVAVISLAPNRECMLSCMQMLELTKLLGATESGAKEMLCSLGEYI